MANLEKALKNLKTHIPRSEEELKYSVKFKWISNWWWIFVEAGFLYLMLFTSVKQWYLPLGFLVILLLSFVLGYSRFNKFRAKTNRWTEHEQRTVLSYCNDFPQIKDVVVKWRIDNHILTDLEMDKVWKVYNALKEKNEQEKALADNLKFLDEQLKENIEEKRTQKFLEKSMPKSTLKKEKKHL